MIEGPYFNRVVRFVDMLKFEHVGVIVSQDDERVYCQSLDSDIDALWHFSISLELLPHVLLPEDYETEPDTASQ